MSDYNKPKYFITAFSIVTITILLLTSFFMQPEKGEFAESTKDALYRDLYKNGAYIVYNPGSDNSMEILAKKVWAAFRKKQNIKILPGNLLTHEILTNNSLILLESENSNKLLDEIFKTYGIILDENTIEFNNYKFKGDNLRLSFQLPNPYNKQKLIIARITDNKAKSFNNSFFLRNDFEVKNNNETLLLAQINYSDLASNRLHFNWVKDFRHKNRKVILDKQTTIIFHANDFDNNFVFDLTRKFNSIYAKISSTFNKSLIHPKIDYNVYNSFEQKGLITGNTNFSSIDGNSIHTVVNNEIKSDDGFSFSKLVIFKNFGSTKLQFIDDGLSTYFSNNWRYADYHEIVARLIKAKAIPDLNYLLDNEKIQFESYLSYQPLGAVFIEFYIDKFGKTSLKKLFSTSETQKRELISLQHKWNDYLSKFSKNYQYKSIRQGKIFNKNLPSFLKGFCFAHEGYQIHNGYISQSAVQSLKRLKSLGTNSISITPFTGMRDPTKAVPLSIWRAAGTENDESVIFISNEAKALRIIPILKPHIYLHNSWPGAIKMANEKEWREFTEYYFRWIKHYALLAQMYKIPLLVVGNELVEFTLSHPKTWREMISKIKIIYDGKITYGSNWGKEFEQLTFWDAFDYISVSNYYPLSGKINPTDTELLSGANTVMNKIESISKKFNKQIIFTEIGYRSSQSAWLTSNESENSKRTVNNQSQLRSYTAISKAIENRAWLKGIYWWKWPSFLYYDTNRKHDLFTPLNKPAEDIVEKIFSRKQN